MEKVGIENDLSDSKVLILQVAGALARFGHYAKELDVDEKLISSIRSQIILL